LIKAIEEVGKDDLWARWVKPSFDQAFWPMVIMMVLCPGEDIGPMCVKTNLGEVVQSVLRGLIFGPPRDAAKTDMSRSDMVWSLWSPAAWIQHRMSNLKDFLIHYTIARLCATCKLAVDGRGRGSHRKTIIAFRDAKKYVCPICIRIWTRSYPECYLIPSVDERINTSFYLCQQNMLKRNLPNSDLI
jgi:hypothetical protein